ncbi:MAG: electron transport complex subunit E [Halioglobus sp.]|nr:electron transport complex subunit E [Halioglobus sp.]
MATEQRDPPSADDLLKGLWRENPVFVQLLGMCPVLAVTNSALNGLTMGVATLFVLVLSNTLVSLLRHAIPREVRIATFILIIASFVTVVDYLIQAISLELHKSLGAFISLIVVNCLILGRAEAFASRHSVSRAVLDGLGMGLGFTCALLCMGAVRELLGSGTLFGLAVLPDAFQPWIVMILPGGGFFTLGAILLLLNAMQSRRAAALAAVEQT